MAKLWQSDGAVCSHVDQSFDHVMARIWQSYGRALAKFGNYGEVKAKLWQGFWQRRGEVMAKGYRGYGEVMFGPILFGGVEQMHGCVEQMHIILIYVYIYIYIMMEMDGLDGFWMENMLV